MQEVIRVKTHFGPDHITAEVCPYPPASDSYSASPPSTRGGTLGNAVGALLMPTLVTLAGSILVAFVLVYYRESLEGIGNWGYVAAFGAEFANSAAVLIPTPGPAYTLATSVFLNPLALGLIGGVAAALGELVGYYLGSRGRSVVEGGRLYERMRAFTSRWGGGALFTFALLPVPFDVAGIWAGTVRYPLGKFFVYIVSGKIIKITTFALLGHYGISLIL